MGSVVVVDDNWVWANAVSRVIDAHPGFRVVDVFGDAAGVIAHLARRPAAIALVDLVLGDETGLRVARAARQRFPRTRVVMMSVEPNRWAVDEAIAAGVAGFVHKHDLESPRVLVDTLSAVAAGGRSFTSRIVSPDTAPAIERVGLEPIEVEIMRGLALGLGTADLVRQLGRADQTIRNRIAAINRKLKTSDRVQIAAWYRDNVREA